jgi:ferredoxin-NADP reductase
MRRARGSKPDPAPAPESSAQQEIDHSLEETFTASDLPAWSGTRPGREAVVKSRDPASFRYRFPGSEHDPDAVKQVQVGTYGMSPGTPGNPVLQREIAEENATGNAGNPTRHVVQLRERHEIAEGTFAFLFDRPPGFTFAAGQRIRLSLRGASETEATTSRIFSLASAPGENRLMIATRIRDSAFKRLLRRSPLGTEVWIQGPFGDFTLHRDPTWPAVLLAGGIGITPFRSMLVEAVAARLPHRFFVFSSNRRPEDAPFLDELQALESTHWSVTLVTTMTQMSRSRRRWTGETAMIDQDLLARFLKHLDSPVYYIAGPPRMANGLRSILRLGGTRSDRVHTEVFEGY